MTTFFISDRNDEKVACGKILDKIGLQGYQVKHALLTDLLCMYQMWTYFSTSELSQKDSVGGYYLFERGCKNT